MRTILFKIKKFFLTLLSFLFHILFDRKSSINNTTYQKEDEKKQAEKRKNNGKFSREEESKGNSYSYKENTKENTNIYPSIKKDINKLYIIQKYVDEISFQLKKDNSYEELQKMYDELEKYKGDILFLQKQIEKYNTNEDEYQEFREICENVNKKIKIEEKTIKINQEKKQEEIQEIENIEKEEQKQENKTEDTKEELKPETKEVAQPFKEKIEIKSIPRKVIKQEERAEKKVNLNSKNGPVKNPDIGNYKLNIENIRNMIRKVNIMKRTKIVKKVSFNIVTAVALTRLLPVNNYNSNKNRNLATALLINKKIRQSENMISNKKIRNMKYKHVVSETLSDDINVNMDFILNDVLAQIRQLRSMIMQYGMTREIINILNQLDELESEILEKISYINTKEKAYEKKTIR